MGGPPPWSVGNGETTMKRRQRRTVWKRYRYGTTPHELHLEEAGWQDLPSDLEYREAGFDPEDEEVTICRLIDAWNGHPAGSVVITGLTVEGHPFAVRQ